MKITKIGHCCLLIENEDKTILTDPGAWTTAQNAIVGIDLVLITHDHADHFHIESLKQILQNNNQCKVVCNKKVGMLLQAENINFIEMNGIEFPELFNLENISIEAFDGRHEEIYGEIGQTQNTGFLVNKKLFYPGDSFINPNREVEILAAPISAPWCTFKEAIDYIKLINPKICLPVHDGYVDLEKLTMLHRVPLNILKEQNIDFKPFQVGEFIELKNNLHR